MWNYHLIISSQCSQQKEPLQFPFLFIKGCSSSGMTVLNIVKLISKVCRVIFTSFQHELKAMFAGKVKVAITFKICFWECLAVMCKKKKRKKKFYGNYYPNVYVALLLYALSFDMLRKLLSLLINTYSVYTLLCRLLYRFNLLAVFCCDVDSSPSAIQRHHLHFIRQTDSCNNPSQISSSLFFNITPCCSYTAVLQAGEGLSCEA